MWLHYKQFPLNLPSTIHLIKPKTIFGISNQRSWILVTQVILTIKMLFWKINISLKLRKSLLTYSRLHIRHLISDHFKALWVFTKISIALYQNVIATLRTSQTVIHLWSLMKDQVIYLEKAKRQQVAYIQW